MPTISDLQLDLSADDLALGSTPCTRFESLPMRARIEAILERLNQDRWLQPVISYGVHDVANHGSDWIELSGAGRIESSPMLAHRMRDAAQLCVGVCSLGNRVSDQIGGWLGHGKQLQAAMLDAIASLALFQLAEKFERLMRDLAASVDLEASGSLIPGEDGFAPTEQGIVIELARGHDIGVCWAGSADLRPPMSMTLVIGFGRRMRRWTRGDGCSRCPARADCAFRRTQTGAAGLEPRA